MGVTNSMPKIADMPIPKAKLRSSSRRGSRNGRSLSGCAPGRSSRTETPAQHSTMISVEPNHSARSPRSSMSCMQATAIDRLRKPIQSSFGRSSRGGSGLIAVNAPANATNANGIKYEENPAPRYLLANIATDQRRDRGRDAHAHRIDRERRPALLARELVDYDRLCDRREGRAEEPTAAPARRPARRARWRGRTSQWRRQIPRPPRSLRGDARSGSRSSRRGEWSPPSQSNWTLRPRRLDRGWLKARLGFAAATRWRW